MFEEYLIIIHLYFVSFSKYLILHFAPNVHEFEEKSKIEGLTKAISSWIFSLKSK